MNTRAVLFAACSGIALVAACGGSSVSSGSNDTDSGGNYASSGGTSSGSSGTSSGTTSSSSSSSSGGTTNPFEAGAIQCNCTAPQVCCISGGMGGAMSSSCMASCPMGTFTYACMTSSDCTGGQVCCASRSGFTCESACGTGDGGMSVQICTQSSDCAAGETCVGRGTFMFCYAVPDGGFPFDGGFGRDGGGNNGGSSGGSSGGDAAPSGDGATE